VSERDTGAGTNKREYRNEAKSGNGPLWGRVGSSKNFQKILSIARAKVRAGCETKEPFLDKKVVFFPHQLINFLPCIN